MYVNSLLLHSRIMYEILSLFVFIIIGIYRRRMIVGEIRVDAAY